MKVCKEFLSIQEGFVEYELGDRIGDTKMDVFSTMNDDKLSIIFWFPENENICLFGFKFHDIELVEMVVQSLVTKVAIQVDYNDYTFLDDDNVLHQGKITNIIDFFALLVHFELVENFVSLPEDTYLTYIDECHSYDENTLDGVTEILIMIFNHLERYEISNQIWKHYQNVKKEKNWINLIYN